MEVSDVKLGKICLFNIPLFKQIHTTKEVRIHSLELVSREEFVLHDVNACLAVYDHMRKSKQEKLAEKMKEYGGEVWEKFNTNKNLPPDQRQ